MNNVEAAPAAAGVAAPRVVPTEPVSIVVDEKLMVVLNKDGGVESMEVSGGMALQVLPFSCTFSCSWLVEACRWHALQLSYVVDVVVYQSLAMHLCAEGLMAGSDVHKPAVTLFLHMDIEDATDLSKLC